MAKIIRPTGTALDRAYDLAARRTWWRSFPQCYTGACQIDKQRTVVVRLCCMFFGELCSCLRSGVLYDAVNFDFDEPPNAKRIMWKNPAVLHTNCSHCAIAHELTRGQKTATYKDSLATYMSREIDASRWIESWPRP